MSTHTSKVKSRPKALLASLTAFLVAFSGLVAMPAVAHAAPGPELSITEAPRAGGQVTVTGTGFDPNDGRGIYIGIGPSGLLGYGQEGSGQITGTQNITPGAAGIQADGSFVATVNVPAFAADTEYSIYTGRAHGGATTDSSQSVQQAVVYEAAPAVQTTTTIAASADSVDEGETVVLTATVTPAEAAGTVTFQQNGTQIGEAQAVNSGVATLTTGELAEGSYDFTATFTPTDAAAFTASSTAAAATVTVEGDEEDDTTPVVPSIEIIGDITDLDPEAENTVTVKGSGFLPNAPATNGTRPPFANQFSGAYVAFASVAEVWQPSKDAASSTRKLGDNKWAVPAGGYDTGTVLNADGTFEVELSLDTSTIDAIETGTWAIITYAGGGAKYAPFEIYNDVTFQSEEDDTEEPEVPNGAELTATVSAANANEFSVDVVASGLPTDIRFAYAALIERDTYLGLAQDGTIAMNAFTPVNAGSASFTLTVDEISLLDPNKEYEVVMWGQHSEANADNFYAADDVEITDEQWEAMSGPGVRLSAKEVQQGDKITFTGTGLVPGTEVTATVHSKPVEVGTARANVNGAVTFNWTVPANFQTGEHTIVLTANGDELASNTFTVTKASATTQSQPATDADTCVARQVTGGSFNWGVKESFRNYFGGNIANGGYEGGSYSATGGAVNIDNNGIGRIDFAGSFRGWGHSGELDYTLSNPSIQITSQTTGVLYATVNGARVAYANLYFSGLSVSENGISGNASASLTTAGANTLLYNGRAMYDAGTQLDGFSFSVSVGGEVPCSSEFGTDPVALANTGSSSDSTIAGMNIAALVTLLGAALVLTARRRGVVAGR